MKVYVYAGDEYGCGHYRMLWPGRAVRDAGMLDVTVVPSSERAVNMRVNRVTGKLTAHNFPQDADVIVLQRPTSTYVAQAIPQLVADGVAVVVDMDDDLSCIHPRNPAWASFQPTVPHPDPKLAKRGARIRNRHTFHNAATSCRAATLVTVTTPALAQRYGAHGRVRVLPNYLPSHHLQAVHVDSDVVGWGGSVHSHPDDLQQLRGAVQAHVRRGGRFMTVGDKRDVAKVLGLREDPEGPGPVPLSEWPQALAEVGVGLAPLAPTAFNEAKSWLKALEMAGSGVPFVASPTSEYRRAESEGAGVVVSRPRAWEAAIRALVADPDRRAELSEAGRDMATRNTIEAHAWRWAEAWTYAAVQARASLARGRAGAR